VIVLRKPWIKENLGPLSAAPTAAIEGEAATGTVS